MKPLRLPAALVLAIAWVAFAPLGAQNAPGRSLDLDDILSFRALGTTALSPDGQWFAWRLSPLEGDSEVFVRAVTSDRQMSYAVGEGGGAMTFSEDSAWLAISVAPTREQARANTRARRPNQNAVTLVNLASGEQTSIPKIRRFEFNGEMSTWIALDRYGPDNAAGAGAGAAGGGRGGGRGGGAAPDANAPRSTRPRGTDLLLRELATGAELGIGNVAEFGFNKSGKHLALVIDAADQAGNGLQIRDMATGAITPLETGKAFYERLGWTTEGDALSVLRGIDDRQYRERLYAVVGFTGFGTGAPAKVVYDPADDASFPKDMAVSGNRSPTWTDERDALIFGIAELTKAPPSSGRGRAGGGAGAAADAEDDEPAGRGRGNDSERPDLVIWHYRDPRLQTQQEVQEAADRRANYVTAYRVGDRKLVRLADDEVPDLAISGRGRWAIGSSDVAYELQGNLDGRRFRDVYAVDTHTGERKLIRKQLRWGNSASPDGSRYLFYENRHFHVFDAATGAVRNVTEGVPASFVNVEDDHNVVDPPTNAVGWSSDGRHVLISDRWDVWKIPAAAGEKAVNLTVNGRKDQIRYTRVRIDPEERGIDLSERQYFSATAEWTKRDGYGVLEPGAAGVKMLLWEDASIARLEKADKADVWIYSSETPTSAPAIYATDASLAAGRRIVDTSSEAEAFRWSSGARLIEFENAKGERLQASLYLPAGYEEGRQYPTIVYIYERLTQGHYQYGRPTANGFNRQAYTSNGYAVLQPDIKYYVNDPGMSAVWALVPAVKAAVATGVVDPRRVGLHGHSWGGYQTAHTITQTDIFAAAIAGAPLTNMISMYSIIYKNSGGTNGAIFESSQGRFTGGPWEEWEAYTRNSPVAHAMNVKTPLMILHNDLDGAVDFTQGVEYFNTLRRLQKPVVMLEYPGENHGLRRPANQQDYTIRMREFFDHHLKDADAPDWLEYGVPRLDMEKHIDERLEAREKAKPDPAAAARGGGGRGGGGIR
jgi:dipeptidyl aminopeptidase/acylaminoacyl peptidase